MATRTSSTKPTSEPPSIDDERLIAASAYLIFFLPMLFRRQSEFAMFHAKQGLVLLIAYVLGQVVLTYLTLLLIGILLWPLFYLAVFALVIIGIINALGGKQTPLPVIGRYADYLKF